MNLPPDSADVGEPRRALRWQRLVAGCAPLALLTTLAVAGVDTGCRRTVDERPVVALATSPAAEARFSSVRARWLVGGAPERAAMRHELTELERWLEETDDGLEPVARAYLAIAWMDANVPAAAEAVARPLYDGAPGVNHDLGVLVRGVVLRRTGHPAEAIEVLAPIVGKLIDPFARPILYEEMTHALMDEGHYDEAVAFAQAWLRSSDGVDRKVLHADVARVLARLPLDVAKRTVDAQRASKGTAGYSPELILILAARLGGGEDMLSIDADGGLALADAESYDAAWLTIPDDAAAAVMVTTPLPVRFDPRAIALLVPTSVVAEGANATAAIRGATSIVTYLMGTEKGDAGPGKGLIDGSVAAPSAASHHLAVFDTGGTAAGVLKSVDAAERDGAALIVGGVTEAESNALATLAQLRKLPTILFRPPSAPPVLANGERRVYVVLGNSLADERAATMAAITSSTAGTGSGGGASTEIAIVDPWPAEGSTEAYPLDPLHARCDATPKSATEPAFPIAAWRARKVTTVVVFGDAHCARHVAADLLGATPAYHPHLVLGPTALELVHETMALMRTAVGGGVLPADDNAPKSLRTLWIDQKSPVGWLGALGHDGAALALAATPGDLLATAESGEIQKARATTLDRLLKAQGELWTTTAAGPNASGVVPRTLYPRTANAGSSWHPAWLAETGGSFYK